jgi:hypothetical protein
LFRAGNRSKKFAAEPYFFLTIKEYENILILEYMKIYKAFSWSKKNLGSSSRPLYGKKEKWK